MTTARSLIFLLSLLVVATGCTESGDPGSSAEGLAESPQPVELNAADSEALLPLAMLRYVPADTPYVWASAKPLSIDALPWRLEELVPLLDAVTTRLTPQNTEAPFNPPSGRLGARRLMWAIGSALDGNLSEEGFERLGVELQPAIVFYGTGLFPTLRMEIADAARIDALIDRVTTQSRLPVEKVEQDGQSLRIITISPRARLALTTQGNTLVAAGFPSDAQDFVLSQLFSTPEQNLADARTLQNALALHGDADALGVGILDLEGLVAGLSGQPGTLAASLQAAGVTTPVLSEACATDVARLTQRFPRLVATATPVSFLDLRQAELTLESRDTPFLLALSALKQPTAVAPTRDVAGFLSVGLDVQGLISMAVDQFADMDPTWGCRRLERLNGAKSKVIFGSALIPQSIKQLKGFSVVVESLESTADGRTRPKGYGTLRGGALDDLLELAQTRVRSVADLELPKPGARSTFAPQGGKLARLGKLHLTRDAKSVSFDFGSEEAQDTQVTLADDGPLVVAGWNGGVLRQHWLRKWAQELDDQTLGVSSVVAELSGRYGLRTVALDVSERGISLRYQRNAGTE